MTNWARSRRAIMVGAASLLAIMAATSAAAQQGPTAATQLDELIVTANKREERLIDVPLAVTALSEQALLRQGVRGLDDYVRLVPGVRLNDNGPGSSVVTMRGVNTSNTVAGQGSTVGFSLDDVPIDVGFNARSTVDMRLFDVERLEVLRGPQGTLQGAQSLSGLVRMVTNRPQLDSFGGAIEGTVSGVAHGSTGGDLNVALNVPLVDDVLAVRATGYITRAPGYVDNRASGDDNQNFTDNSGARLQVRWRPASTITFDAGYTYQLIRNKALNVVYRNPSVGTGDVYEYDHILPNKVNVEFDQLRFGFDWDLGWATLTDVTAYSRKKIDTTDEGYLAGLKGRIDTPSSSKIFSQELRLASNDGDAPLKWLVGGFYSHRDGGFNQVLTAPPLPVLLNVLVGSTLEELAGFGDLTFTGIPNWEVALGARYTNSKYDFDVQRSGLAFPLGPDKASNSENIFTPRLSVSYRPTDRQNFYFLISKGWRSGGYNSASGIAAGAPKTYDSDTLWNYELGAKTRLLDDRLDINVALYRLEWKSVQIQARDPRSGFNFNDNAGSAEGKGIEVEARFRPTDRVELGTAFSFSDTELSEDTPVFQATGVAGARKGDRLPASAEFNIANFVEVRLPFERDPFVRVDHSYIGSAFTGFAGTGTRFGDYHLVSVRAGLSFGETQVIAFVSNLFDEDAITNATDPGGVFDLRGRAFRVQPRTIGITVRSGF